MAAEYPQVKRVEVEVDANLLVQWMAYGYGLMGTIGEYPIWYPILERFWRNSWK